MSALPRILVCTYLCLSIYAIGGAVVEGFVYYPAWKVVGAEEFPAFHRSLSDRLIPAFVVPFFLSVFANGLLLWRRPAEVSRNLVLLTFGLNLLILVVTATLAIPIQTQLATAQSIEAIDRLIGYDRPLRLFPGLIVGMVNWVMLYRLAGGGVRNSPAAPQG